MTGVLFIARSVDENLLAERRPGVLDDPTSRLADHLRQNVERWFQILSAWIEVCTAQDLDYEHPLYTAWAEGAGLHLWSDSKELMGGQRMVLTTPTITPITPSLWVHAVTSAAQGTLPPLELQLVRDGRSAFMRGLHRTAVLSAASAIEAGAHALGVSVRNMKPKLTELVALGFITEAEKDRALVTVAAVRNSVIHDGYNPTPSESYEAVEAAHIVIMSARKGAATRAAASNA